MLNTELPWDSTPYDTPSNSGGVYSHQAHVGMLIQHYTEIAEKPKWHKYLPADGQKRCSMSK